MKRRTEEPKNGRELASAQELFEAPASTPSFDHDLVVLPPGDAFDTLTAVRDPVQTVILDPWYNKGVGGTRDDYTSWLAALVDASFRCARHVFVWGFPEIVGRVLDHLPDGIELVAWLTWYYKNCPSVVRGWRSAQYTCLHLGRAGAELFPERFLNQAQLERKSQGKLRYMPGPPNVIEAPLNIGFVGKSEQTGHPAQKPMAVIEPLILMTTHPGDLVLDPMCGSGTTGAVCQRLRRRAVLCDASEEYLSLTEARLHVCRRGSQRSPKYFFKNA